MLLHMFSEYCDLHFHVIFFRITIRRFAPSQNPGVPLSTWLQVFYIRCGTIIDTYPGWAVCIDGITIAVATVGWPWTTAWAWKGTTFAVAAGTMLTIPGAASRVAYSGFEGTAKSYGSSLSQQRRQYEYWHFDILSDWEQAIRYLQLFSVHSIINTLLMGFISIHKIHFKLYQQLIWIRLATLMTIKCTHQSRFT
jgi:hypothetical protein